MEGLRNMSPDPDIQGTPAFMGGGRGCPTDCLREPRLMFANFSVESNTPRAVLPLFNEPSNQRLSKVSCEGILDITRQQQISFKKKQTFETSNAYKERKSKKHSTHHPQTKPHFFLYFFLLSNVRCITIWMISRRN